MDTLQPSHNQKCFSLRQMATIMAGIYLLIILSPLASLSLHSTSFAYAATGECSGDCNICGCSLESRTNKTCCCAQKHKQQLVHEHDDGETGTPDCCKKESAPQKTVIAKCGCPCGSGTSSGITNNVISETIPSHFCEIVSIPHVNTRYNAFAHFLTSRHIEPPDPPPRQA